MGGSSHAPKAPSYAPITNAAETNAQTAQQVAQQELAMQKQQYDYLMSQYNNAQPAIDAAVNNGLDLANLDKNWANTQEGAYASTLPALQDFTNQALNWNSDANRALWMGRASGAVRDAEDAQRENTVRDLESYGINPASTRYASLDAGLRAKEAADQAKAANDASFGLAQTGMGYEAQATQLGAQQAGLASTNSANSNAAGTAAGNLKLADVATAGSVLGTPVQYASLVPQNTNAASNALGTATQAQGTQYKGSLDQFNANQQASSGVGAAIGAAAGIGTKLAMAPATGGGSLAGNLLAASGGVIPEFRPGGPVTPGMSPSGGAQTDDVTARLNAGEFVVPKDVLNWKGEEFFQKLVAGARNQRQTQTVAAPRVSTGPMPGSHMPPRPVMPPRGAIPMR